MRTVKVKIRGKTESFPETMTKADIARFLFSDDAGYSVNEVSKAVPMAYSQALTIRKKTQPRPATKSKPKPTLEDHAREIPTARQAKRAAKPQKSTFGTTARVGKLRTGGLPSDIDVGPCANCGHDLVVRRGGAAGYLIIHVNTTAEEYLATTQFCQAVPEVLLS